METETNIQEDASAMGIVLPEGMDKVCAEKEQADHHSETQSMEEVIIKHSNSEEKMTTESSTKSTYDMGELEKIPESHSIENLSIKDGGNIMPKEAKDIKETTDVELQKSETESNYLPKGVPEDESTSTLPKLAIDQAETAEKGFEKETLEEEESTEIDNNQCCRPQNELEQTIKAFEEIDLPQTMGKDAAENEHTDHQSEAPGIENVITKHSYSEGTLTMESSTKPSYDEEEPEKIPESHCVDNPEIKDCGKLMPEKSIDIKEDTEVELQKSETESVPEDKALSTLPITASVPVEAIVKSIEEEIHKKEESAVTDAEEGQRPEYDFEKKVPEALDLHEATDNTSKENEKKDENQSELQSVETLVVMHPKFEGPETTVISPRNNTEELEKDPASHNRNKLEMKDGGNIIQEEKGMELREEAKDMQLLKSTIESVPEDESLPTLHTPEFFKREMFEKSFHEQTRKEEEPTAIENDKRRGPGKELEQTKILEVDEETEENADHQSEVSSMEKVITKHINTEGKKTTEISTKSSYDTDKLEKNPEPHSVNNSENKEVGKITQEEAIDIKETTNMELQKSETESVPADKALTTLLTKASVRVETVEESIQEEIHKEAQSAVTDTKEGQSPENNFEDKMKVPEAFNLHKAMANTCLEIEKKAEPRPEAESLETIVIKHLNLEGETTEVKPSNDTIEHEMITASHTGEKLDIKDGGKCIQEEAKVLEETTDMQLHKTGTESIPEDEAQSSFPASAIVKGETVEETLVEQTLKEEESAAIDKDNRCPPENEIEQTANIAESISQPKTMVKAGAEYEENDDHQYETSSMENVITKHISAEEKVAIENSTKSSHNVDKLEKIAESHSVDNSEIKDGDKIMPEDATDIKGANDVELQKSESESEPKDKALSTLATTASVGIGTVEKSIKEEIDTAAESAVKDTYEGHQPENDFAEIKKLPKAIDLYKVTHHTFTENEEKAESQPEELNLENTVIEHPNLEEETTEINPATYTEQQEKVPASHTGEKLDIKDYGKFIHEEAKNMDDAIDIQLLKTSTESVPDEAQTTLPTSAIVKGEMVQEILQRQTIREEEPAATDNDNSCNPENEPDNTANVVEAIDHSKIMANIGAENEEQANHPSEPPSMGSVVTKHINAETNVTCESSTNLDNDEDKKEKNTESHPIEDLGMKDGSKITPEEETDVKKSTDAELQKSEAESVPSLSTLPSTASAGDETVEKGIQEETHTEVESAVTDTKEGQIPENEVEEKKKVPEAFDLHKTTSHTSTENGPKTELQSEVQNPEIPVIKHPNMEAETKEIYPTKDSEEYQKVPASHSREKIENEDDVKFIQEEAKDMEEATDMLSLETATESVHDDKTRTTLPTSARVEGELVEEILQQQTLKEEESAEIDNDNSCSPENELDNSVNIVKAIDQPKNMANVRAENEEHADHQSETSSMEDIVTKHIDAEGKVTSESGTNSCYDVDKLEQIPESRSIENSGVKDASKIIPEEATDVEKSSDAELQKYKAESVPEDKSLSTLPSTVSARDRTVGKSIQEETHTEVESAVKDTKERKIPENEVDEKKKVPEEFDLHKITSHSSAENEPKAELQSEVHSLEMTGIKHPILEAETTEINPTEDSEEYLKVRASHTEEKLENEDDGKFIQEQAKETEEATDMQLLETARGSVPNDEVQSTLPTSGIVKGEMVEVILQQQTLSEEESEVDNDKICTPENELEKAANVVEAIDQPETTVKVGAENEHADHQSEASNMESVIAKHINTDGKVTSESNTCSRHDVDELEKIPESHLDENSGIRNGNKIMPEEAIDVKESIAVDLQKTAAESVLEDKALSTLPSTASVGVESVEESLQEDIHAQAESTMTNIKEGQIPENDFKEKNKVPEAFDEYDMTHHTSIENEQKTEALAEVQNMETTIIKHPNLDRETTEIDQTICIEEHEQDLPSHTTEKLEIKDDEKFIQEEAKEMEDVSDTQLLQTTTESVPEDEGWSTLPTSVIVKGEMVEEILQQKAFKEEESTAMDNKKSYTPEHELEITANFVQAIDQPETIASFGAENEVHADHQSDVSSTESMTTKHINAEGKVTSESNTNSSYDVDELEKIPESHSVENSEINAGAPEDKSISSLPNTASVRVGAVEESIQEEIHTQVESATTDTKEGQMPENDFEEKDKVPEAFDLHKVICHTSSDNEQKAETESEAQKLETTVSKHPKLEGETTEINPTNGPKENEKVPASHSGEKLEIEDDAEFIHEEAKEMEEATDMHLRKTATATVLEDEVQSTFPTSTIVKGEKIEEIFQEQTLEEEESAAVDNNDSCRPENELDHLANVFEATDQPKTVAKEGAENVDHQYEQSMENMTTKHISSEGMVTTENSSKSSYDVEELEKVPDLDYVGNDAEIKDAGKITLEEAIDIKEATDVELQKPEIESVPEEKSISTLSKVSSVRVETVEERIREELQNEAEPAVTDVQEGQRIENDFEENMKVLEAFGPQKATGNTYAENEKKAEPQPQSEAQRMETTVIKHPYLKGLETAEKSPSIYIDELEKVPTSHTGENLDIKDGGKIIQEEATEIQSLKTATQSVHKDETPSTLATVEGETVEQSFQDQTPKEEESTENEENADYQSEAPSMENVITKQNAGKIILEEAIDIKEATDVELQKSETDNVPEDKALSTLPTTASVTVEAIEKSTREEIHKKEESAVTDTEEGQRPEYDFEKNKVPQTFHIHKGRGNTCVENEKKAETQSEAQTIETMVIKYSNLEGQVATEINPDIDTEVLEKVPVSQEGEKLEIKDGKIIKEEEKERGEATSMQSPKTAIQSLPEDESSSTLPTWTFVKGETFEKNFSEQTLKEEESTEIENKSCRTENQLEQTTKVLEASDLAKLMGKVSAENEEHTDHQSEVGTENVIMEYTNSEGMLTTESSRKSSYVEELENIPESHSFENSEIMDSGKTMPEEEICIQEASDVKLQKSETESMPKDKALSTLPTKAPGEAETVEKSIQQEIRKETESAETDTKEGQIPENDFKENMEVLKAFDLQKATRNTCTENEKKAEPQSEVQSVETMPIKHQNLGLETTNINPSNNTVELEKVPASHTTRKLEIKDGRKIIQGEDEANTQLLKSTTESVLEDESTSTLATLPTVKGETFEKSYQEQKHKEEETTMIENNKSCRKKNELEQMTEAVEHALKKALDLPKLMGKDSAENEEHAGHQSEAPSMEDVIIKHTKSEEMVTVESSTKSNYDVVELEKISEPHPFKNLEIEDGGKIVPEEAVDIKEGVPEDKAISTVPTIASVGVETFKKGIQEEIHKETESAVTDTKRGQSPENEFEENTNVLEAFDLHKVTGNTCVENAKKAEAQSEVQSLDTMVIKHPNLEGLETKKINPSNDTTTELEGKHKVSEPGGGSELVSVDVTKECSNKDIPMLGDLPMLSDQNPKNNNSDISKISASDHCKLDSEKEENLLIEASGCTATSKHKNSELIKGQENSETTFIDSLIGFAGERAPTELETEDSSHEHPTTDDTPAEKIVKAADTNEKFELAPESIAIEQSDKNNSFESSMYTADGTSMYDGNGEKVRNSLESIVAGELVAKLDPDYQSDMHESTKMDESELAVAAEKIPGLPYPGKKLESYFDSDAHEQTKEKSNNIQDQISESDHHIQQQEFQCENQIKPEPQMEAEHDFSVPLNAKKNPVTSLITKEVHDGADKADASKNIETQTIGSDKSLSEVQLLFPGEETVNQVKDHSIKNFKATDSQEQRAIADLSFENDPIRKDATSKDTDEVIEQPATGKQETQEAETTQVGTEKEDEGDDFEKISPSSSSTVMIKDSQHSDVKVSHKKSHGILSGVGSKVKHSISKVKKAITGKSSHPKTPSPK